MGSSHWSDVHSTTEQHESFQINTKTYIRRYSSVVERALCKRTVEGSIPSAGLMCELKFSTKFCHQFNVKGQWTSHWKMSTAEHKVLSFQKIAHFFGSKVPNLKKIETLEKKKDRGSRRPGSGTKPRQKIFWHFTVRHLTRNCCKSIQLDEFYLSLEFQKISWSSRNFLTAFRQLVGDFFFLKFGDAIWLN